MAIELIYKVIQIFCLLEQGSYQMYMILVLAEDEAELEPTLVSLLCAYIEHC